MFDRIARWQPDRGAAVAVRTVGALALIALAVIHVVDLPGTLASRPAGPAASQGHTHCAPPPLSASPPE